MPTREFKLVLTLKPSNSLSSTTYLIFFRNLRSHSNDNPFNYEPEKFKIYIKTVFSINLPTCYCSASKNSLCLIEVGETNTSARSFTLLNCTSNRPKALEDVQSEQIGGLPSSIKKKEKN